MRDELPTPGEFDLQESDEREDRLDRDMEREPLEPYLAAHDHEDGYEKSLMVGFEPNDDDDQSLAHMGELGEG